MTKPVVSRIRASGLPSVIRKCGQHCKPDPEARTARISPPPFSLRSPPAGPLAGRKRTRRASERPSVTRRCGLRCKPDLTQVSPSRARRSRKEFDLGGAVSGMPQPPCRCRHGLRVEPAMTTSVVARNSGITPAPLCHPALRLSSPPPFCHPGPDPGSMLPVPLHAPVRHGLRVGPALTMDASSPTPTCCSPALTPSSTP